jgi:hypothetical protein
MLTRVFHLYLTDNPTGLFSVIPTLALLICSLLRHIWLSPLHLYFYLQGAASDNRGSQQLLFIGSFFHLQLSPLGLICNDSEVDLSTHLLYLFQSLLLFLILLFFHQFCEILLDTVGPRNWVLSVVVSGELRD